MAPRQESSTSASSDITESPWSNSTPEVLLDEATTLWSTSSEDLRPSNSSWSDCSGLRLRCDQLSNCALDNCTEVLNNCSAGNCSETNDWFNCTTQCEAWTNCTRDLAQCGEVDGGDGVPNLTEFHIIKAVVLVAVTSVLLLSVCRMVLQLFVKYTTVKQDK